MMMGLAWAGLTLSALALSLVAERRHWPRWVLPAKAMASTGFIGAALAAGSLASAYGRWVLVALSLCWLGDLLLVPKGKGWFLAGLTAFLLGHVGYVVAFVTLGCDPTLAVGMLIAMAAPGIAIGRWLWPQLPPTMRGPVLAYILVISSMVAAAFSARMSGASWLLPAGAALFYLSDISVARDRFFAVGFSNRIWGLSAYYVGQLLFAASVSL